MRILKFSILLLALAAVIVLGVQNPQPISVTFLKWHTAPVSLLIIVLASALGGLVFGFVIGWTPSRKPTEPAPERETTPDENRPA